MIGLSTLIALYKSRNKVLALVSMVLGLFAIIILPIINIFIINKTMDAQISFGFSTWLASLLHMGIIGAAAYGVALYNQYTSQ